MQGTPLSPGPEGHTGTDTAPQRRGGRRNLPGDPAREELGGSERRGARVQGGGHPHQPGSHGKQQRKVPSRCRRPERTATTWQPAGALSSPRPPGETLSSQSRTCRAVAWGTEKRDSRRQPPSPTQGRRNLRPARDVCGPGAAWGLGPPGSGLSRGTERRRPPAASRRLRRSLTASHQGNGHEAGDGAACWVAHTHAAHSPTRVCARMETVNEQSPGARGRMRIIVTVRCSRV